MLSYSPINGTFPGQQDILKLEFFPKKAFLMVSLGSQTQEEKGIIKHIKRLLKTEHGFDSFDASSVISTHDYLEKIWYQIQSVGLGIAVINKDTPAQTAANIFYEIGIMQSLGKTVCIIKTEDARVPSDFVRTEHIEYSRRTFKEKLSRFFEWLDKQMQFKLTVADALKNDPVLSIEHLISAYLLSGNKSLLERVKVKLEDNTKFIPDFIRQYYEQFLRASLAQFPVKLS